MALAGTGLIALGAHAGTAGATGDPAVPQANGLIAFTRYANPSDGDIYTVDADGSGEVLVAGGLADDEHPSWSHTGEELVFTSEHPVAVERGVEYAAPGGRPLYVDVYVPPPSFARPRPGIVLPVFAGLHDSDRNYPGFPQIASDLAARGYVVYVAEVRSPDDGHLYPAAEDDARSLVAWVRSSAAAWEVDPARLGAFGPSGSAYLSAAVAYRGSGDLGTGSRVRAWAGWSGPLNLWEIPAKRTDNIPTSRYLGCDPMAASASTACQDLAKDASPTEMVDGTDPPAFIRHSVDETVPIDHARSMRAALDAALVTADYEEIPGSAHALKLKPQEFAETVAFFDRHLLPEGASSVPHLSGIFGTNTGGGSRWPVADLHGRDERADWSPDGEAVVFTSEQGGDPDIHTVEAAGEPPTNISRNAAGDWEPDWSPDGTEVAFTTDRLGSRDIFIMDGDGTDPRPLVRGGAPERNPVWSPDGTKIAFDSRRSTTGTDIYVVNRDGTGLVRLTDTPGDDREPAWSPDGTRIVFSSNRDGDHDIYVMDADGSDAAPLVSGPLEERDPDWGGAPSAGIVPTLSVDDTSVGEPSSGTAPATFTVSLSPPSTSEVTVAYATSNGSAAAGSDFTTSTGTLTFQAGETVRTVSVPVIGDTVVEPHETFYVDLSAPVSATIDDGRGVATILDDDGSCTVRGTPSNDVLDGTAAADVICGFGGGDTLDALGGNDTVDAGSGDDTVLGGEGHDTVAGGTGADRLVGESGNDLLTGGSGADVLQGDGGNDRLSARDRVPGNDSVDGGAGVDRCPADPGDVVASCP